MPSGIRANQAITWAKFYKDLCHHMASLGHNELNHNNSFEDWTPKNFASRCPCSNELERLTDYMYLTWQGTRIVASVMPTTQYALFSCDQAALQMVFSVRPSVCPSVRPSVCHTFFTMFPSSYHHEIFRSYYHGQKWCPCKRSRSEVKGQGHRAQHPT